MGKLGCIVEAGTEDNSGVAETGPVDGPTAGPTAETLRPGARDGTSPREVPVGLNFEDSENFGNFYAGHYRDLVRLAALLSGSADAAPDLVQDCFVRMHGRWNAVNDPLPYMRRSIVHACASHHRHISRGRRLPLPRARDSELVADEMEDALGTLPARQRAAVVLRYYGDLPDAEIARALGCRPSTVRSLIHRALSDLRKVIEQ